MILFNDSISKFYQCSIWAFAEEYLCFLASALAIKFLIILKIDVSKNKIFLFKKEKQCFA